MTGTVSAPGGQRLPGVTIEASVEPTADQLAALPAGAEITPTVIGSAVTNSSGEFKLSVTNPGAVSAGRDSDGLVAVVLSGPTTQGQVLYRTRMALTVAGKLDGYQPDLSTEAVDRGADESQTTDAGDAEVPNLDLVTLQVAPTEVVQPAPVPDEPAASAEPEEQTPVPAPVKCPKFQVCEFRPDATDPTTDTATNPAEPEPTWAEQPRTDQPAFAPPTDVEAPPVSALVKTSASAASASAAAASVTPDAGVWCKGHHWYRKKSADTVKLHVTLMSQATGGSTTGQFEYKTTKGTSLEIGITNKAGSLVSTLGMTKGATHSASVKAKIPKNTKAEWWVSYDFNIYDFWCQHNTTHVKWFSGYTEFRAKEFAGDASRRSWKPFACQTKHEASLGPTFTATVADDKTTTRTGAFNVGSGTAGNLKASQTWGSTQTVTYEAIGDASYTLCGDKGKWFTSVTKTRQV